MNGLGVQEHGPRRGIPLVLLHAFPFDHRMWNDVIDELSDVWTIAIDAPGFADSASPRILMERVEPGVYGLEMFADSVATLLAKSGIDKAVIAGVSMGGYTALAIAERHPDLVAGLALIDTKASPDDDVAAENRRTMADEASRGISTGLRHMAGKVLSDETEDERPAMYTQVVKWIGQAPFAGIAWAQKSMADRPGRLHVLEGLDVPAVVIRGEHDDLSTQSDHQEMADALGCELVTIEHAGHLSPFEQPQEVAGALRELMARVN